VRSAGRSWEYAFSPARAGVDSRKGRRKKKHNREKNKVATWGLKKDYRERAGAVIKEHGIVFRAMTFEVKKAKRRKPKSRRNFLGKRGVGSKH